MDTAMRDLELIQERHEDDSPGRKAAMLGMAGLSTVALVFAMGVMLGGPSQSEPTRDEDPLLALSDTLSRGAAVEDEAAEDADEAQDESAPIQPGEVQFHDQLTDDRPEVEAALAAAAAEQQTLGATGGAPLGVVEQAVGLPPQELAPAPTIVTPASAPAGDVARMPTESAVPENVRPAAAGHAGAFTLQVVSYRTREEAELFADALRGRGHEAFTARVELPGRGAFFRVRIGPFTSRVAAERYRATFEREEGMNTYVVDAARAAANGQP